MTPHISFLLALGTHFSEWPISLLIGVGDIVGWPAGYNEFGIIFLSASRQHLSTHKQCYIICSGKPRSCDCFSHSSVALQMVQGRKFFPSFHLFMGLILPFVLLFPLTSDYYFVTRRALPYEAGNILKVDLVYRTPLSTSPINTVCGIILRVDDGRRSATVAYYNRRKLDSTRCWFTIKLMSLIGSQAELLQRRAVYPRVERKKIAGPPSRLRANPDQLKFPVCRVPSVPILL